MYLRFDIATQKSCILKLIDKRIFIRYNGYYSGSVFKPNEYSFRPSIYFALRRGKNSFINVAP